MAKKEKKKDLGLGVNTPKDKCEDPHCPFHGKLAVRGRIFKGTVKKVDLNKTATVEWDRRYYLRKYERYEKRRSRVRAHNPACINILVSNVQGRFQNNPGTNPNHNISL